MIINPNSFSQITNVMIKAYNDGRLLFIDIRIKQESMLNPEDILIIKHHSSLRRMTKYKNNKKYKWQW